MTEAQIVTLALVLVASLGAILYNNFRITDLRTDLIGRMGDLRTDVDARISELRADINKRFDLADQHLNDKFALLIARFERMDDNVTRILGDHETRLQN